jgi:single-strand DNA-binding protein
MNQLIIIGNVGREPEMTYTPTGTAVTKFSIADNLPKRKDQAEGETQWFNCVCFNKTAEIASQYIKKGGKVYISGTFHARAYTTKDGRAGTALEIIVDKLQLLDSKPTDASATAPAGEGEDFPF